MKKISTPLGARVIVEEIITTLSLEARGEASNIYVVTEERNRPNSTQGKVVALGNDPILRESGLREGSIVTFAELSGKYVFIEDVRYRCIEWQEIIMVTNEVPEEVVNEVLADSPNATEHDFSSPTENHSTQAYDPASDPAASERRATIATRAHAGATRTVEHGEDRG
jgi:co-chaperonin GroES (HSP10)